MSATAPVARGFDFTSFTTSAVSICGSARFHRSRSACSFARCFSWWSTTFFAGFSGADLDVPRAAALACFGQCVRHFVLSTHTSNASPRPGPAATTPRTENSHGFDCFLPSARRQLDSQNVRSFGSRASSFTKCP